MGHAKLGPAFTRSPKSNAAGGTFTGCRCPVTAQSGRCITCTPLLPNPAKSATYRKSRCSSAVPVPAPSTRGSAHAVTSSRARWPCARAACEVGGHPAQHLPTPGWQAPALSELQPRSRRVSRLQPLSLAKNRKRGLRRQQLHPRRLLALITGLVVKQMG